MKTYQTTRAALTAFLGLVFCVAIAGAQDDCRRPALPELTPQAALDSLRAGNLRFVGDRMLQRSMRCGRDTTKKQRPLAVVLSCMDSRAAAEMVFDRGIGEVFSLRTAGNVLSNDVLGGMEFATVLSNVKVIAVVGHTSCGAIAGACNHDYRLENLTDLLVKIEPAVQAVDSTIQPRNGSNPAFVRAVTLANVLYTMDQIPKRSPAIKQLLDKGLVRLVAGIHDLDSGTVRFYWEYKPR